MWKTGEMGRAEVLRFCASSNTAILPPSRFQVVCTKHLLSELQVFMLPRVAIFAALTRFLSFMH